MARYFLPVFVLFLLAQQLSAQCSDAGACVIGGAPMDAQHHSVTVNYVFGSSGGDEALTFHGIQIDGVVGLYEDAALIIRLPYTSIDGPLGSSDHGSRLSLQVGGKLATGPVNEGGLPQAYQPGLGTNDVIAGLSYETAQWMFAAGYQLSTGRSENAVNRLERGDDLFARAGYSYADVEDLTLGLEVIAIKRLGEDNIRYMIGELDSFVDVADSDQMQVNVLGKAAYSLAANISVVGQVAVPLMQRDVNIDGLKRALSIAAGAQFSF
jgi:hypothetical protein